MSGAGVLLQHLRRTTALSFLLLILNVHAKSLNSQTIPPETSDAESWVITGASFTVPLIRRSSETELREEEYGLWARIQGQSLNAKYGGVQAKNQSSLHARGNGTTYLLNQNTDSAFYAAIGIGTPPVVMNVIMDTGSSDLWVAGPQCDGGCPSDLPLFDGNRSSTFHDVSSSFSVQYGSASATGTLARDTVQMAGYAVEDQAFAVVNGITPGLLSTPVSGLMGLAFRGIASSSATPFWSRVAASGLWDKPLMSFCLTRFLGVDGAKNLEPGGVFIMGGLNHSLYTGEIDYVPLPRLGGYWQLPLLSLKVGNVSIPLPDGSGSYAAIDTGTTLIGGPLAIIDQIAAQIPGSTPGTGNYEDYFLYPCESATNVSLSFGGKAWEISPRDFRLLRLRTGECVSAFFRLSIGSNAPKFIIGDTFLKTVYSVFQYEPPQVGFADLSTTALGLSAIGQPLPTPSLGASIIIKGSATALRVPSLATLFYLLLPVSFALFARTTLYY